MKMKQLLVASAIILITIAISLISPSCSKKENIFTIGFVQILEDRTLDAGRESVFKAIKDAGFKENIDYKIIYKNAQGEISNIPLILRQFKSEKVDLVITNGTPCMVAAAQFFTNIPVIYTIAFGPDQMGIKKPKTMTGVYDPFDMHYVLTEILKMMPKIKSLGLAYNTAEPNARFAADEIIKAANNLNLHLEVLGVESTSDLIQATEVLIQKDIDAIISSADNRFNSALESISKLASKKNIPIFITDPSNLSKGALAGIGADYEEWGYESGKMAAEFIKGKKIEELKEIQLLPYKFYLNMKIAKALNITIPDSMISKAGKIIY